SAAKAAVERRKAQPAGVIGWRSLAVQGSARPRGGSRVRRFRTSADRRSAPSVCRGDKKGIKPSGAKKMRRENDEACNKLPCPLRTRMDETAAINDRFQME